MWRIIIVSGSGMIIATFTYIYRRLSRKFRNISGGARKGTLRALVQACGQMAALHLFDLVKRIYIHLNPMRTEAASQIEARFIEDLGLKRPGRSRKQLAPPEEDLIRDGPAQVARARTFSCSAVPAVTWHLGRPAKLRTRRSESDGAAFGSARRGSVAQPSSGDTFEVMDKNEDRGEWFSSAEEALASQLAPYVRAVRYFILDAQATRAKGLPLPLAQRLALGSEAAKRELQGNPRHSWTGYGQSSLPG
jgi:hypothetical protein